MTRTSPKEGTSNWNRRSRSAVRRRRSKLEGRQPLCPTVRASSPYLSDVVAGKPRALKKSCLSGGISASDARDEHGPLTGVDGPHCSLRGSLANGMVCQDLLETMRASSSKMSRLRARICPFLVQTSALLEADANDNQNFYAPFLLFVPFFFWLAFKHHHCAYPLVKAFLVFAHSFSAYHDAREDLAHMHTRDADFAPVDA